MIPIEFPAKVNPFLVPGYTSTQAIDFLVEEDVPAKS